MNNEGMAITLKNEEVEKMAREVAQRNGTSLTDAIGHALREQLRQIKMARRAPRTEAVLLEISKRCSSLPDKDPRSPDEILGYNNEGFFPHGD
ncbi:MAG: type II toxin-antitoxin system VapB family antitoxin [Kiritimatiellia bacterium]